MRPNSCVNLGRTTRHALVCVLTATALLASAARAQDDAAPLVSHSAQGYSLDASATPIVQILTEIGQRAGFTIEAPDTFSSQITASMRDVPLDQLLRRVLRDENYIIVYRGGVQKTSVSGEKIDRIFLLSQAAASGAKAPGGGSPLAGPGGAGAKGQGPGPPGVLQAPPPPPGEEEGGDIATRSARARARAEARRAALAEGQQPGAADSGAQVVPQAEDFTPPPEEPMGHTGDVPAVDVPPEGGDE